MRTKLTMILSGLLLTVGWSPAVAQQPAESPTQRLALTVVDNKSVYDINAQTNTYTNILRLSQPAGSNKLTAGMLKAGDNFITITRQGIKDGENAGPAADIARLNLNAEIVKGEVETLSQLTLSSTTVNQSGWSASGLRSAGWGSSGYYIRSGNNYHLTYTIPAGYTDVTIIVQIGAYTAGYFKINGRVCSAKANQYNNFYFAHLSSGDQIKIQGCDSNGNSASSPNMESVSIYVLPSLLPSVHITSSISHKNGDSWGASTELVASTPHALNDLINLDGLNVDVTDTFSESTASNSHASSYNYTASLDANISWTSSDISGDFYASADYEQGDGTLEGFVLTGPNNWEYQLVGAQDDDIMCMWLPNYGSILYTMPNSYAGSSVDVVMKADSGTNSGGSILVNGIKHTFSPGETYTWTLPISANGTILFTCDPSENYTLNVSKVEIKGGTGTALHAWNYTCGHQEATNQLIPLSGIQVRQLDSALTKKECVNIKHED